MKTHLLTFSLLVVFLLLHSCMSYMEITKNLPPEIELKDPTPNVAFVNLYDYEMLDFGSDNKIGVYHTGVKKFIASLQENFRNDNRFSFIIEDTLVKGRCKDQLAGPLSHDSIVYFCRKGNTEYLLALEAFRLYFDKEMEVVKNDDGSKSRTAHYSLYVDAGLSLYDSTGVAIDRDRISRFKFYQSRSVLSGLLAAGPSMGGAGNEVNGLATELGGDYIRKFYPSTVTETKQIYVGKKFAEVTPLMQSGRWEEAKEKLIPLINSGDYKVRRRAAHNLSIVYEALGKSDLAEKWWNESKSQKMKDPAYVPGKIE